MADGMADAVCIRPVSKVLTCCAMTPSYPVPSMSIECVSFAACCPLRAFKYRGRDFLNGTSVPLAVLAIKGPVTSL